MHTNSSTNDPYFEDNHHQQRRYDVLDEEEEEELGNQDGIIYSEEGAYPSSSMDHNSAEEYGGTNASYTDVSLQHYQQDREQTPDYDSAPNASIPTTSNYMLDNEVNHEDIYDEYSQYDQTNDVRYDNNYISPPLPSDSPNNNYDVDMEDFGDVVGSRQATPQQQLYTLNSSSSRSGSGLRR